MGLDPGDQRVPYVQVADALRTAIRDGTYREGDRLPSVAELATEFGVAKMTVGRAIATLRTEGLLVSWHGRGTFVKQRGKDGASTDGPPEGASDEVEALRQELARIRQRLDQLEAGQQGD